MYQYNNKCTCNLFINVYTAATHIYAYIRLRRNADFINKDKKRSVKKKKERTKHPVNIQIYIYNVYKTFK